MIEAVKKLSGFENTVLAARVEALELSYGQTVGIERFVATENGVVTAIIGGMDGSFSVEAYDGCDFAELSEFLSFKRADVICSSETAERLKCKTVTEARLLELTDRKDTVGERNSQKGRISEVYEALRFGCDGDIILPPFPLWYADFCVRYNHRAAEYVLLDGAVAVSGFMTERATLITGVAVDPDKRGRHLGSKALSMLCDNIRAEYPKSRIFALTDGATEFYLKNGFSHIGKMALCEF